jgi:hypothetical protein
VSDVIISSNPARQHFVQIAYHVRDIDEAMSRWQRSFGLGPFVVRRHIALEQVLYRGAPSSLDISAAHVQAGPVQIELVVQHNDAPSAFRDSFGPDQEGIHHTALVPDDHDAMVAHYKNHGFAVATEFVTGEGRGASYVDARSAMGHMVEIYRVNQSLHDFYAFIADAAAAWDGKTLAIEL